MYEEKKGNVRLKKRREMCFVFAKSIKYEYED